MKPLLRLSLSPLFFCSLTALLFSHSLLAKMDLESGQVYAKNYEEERESTSATLLNNRARVLIKVLKDNKVPDDNKPGLFRRLRERLPNKEPGKIILPKYNISGMKCSVVKGNWTCSISLHKKKWHSIDASSSSDVLGLYERYIDQDTQSFEVSDISCTAGREGYQSRCTSYVLTRK
ncbi:MAG: hypothetical protein KA436_04005 [Oligoflexales bacterium]|nr:hypothetical protein [Oligoflexales bacterium]